MKKCPGRLPAGGIDAVAFDLDGTLYPNYRLYLRLVPFILKEHRLLRAFGRARDLIRKIQVSQVPPPEAGDFYDNQARLIARALRGDPLVIKETLERLIYRGWEPLFKKIKLYPYVPETLKALRERGLKLGMLSDFPPELKLKYLGLGDCWDTVLCSERLGGLKPYGAPFLELARSLDLGADRILYVGNSVSYDIAGAKQAGMKAALVASSPGKGRRGSADFVFSDYRQLRDYVLS
jgi:putative hydrolase of the HAD superfamily